MMSETKVFVYQVNTPFLEFLVSLMSRSVFRKVQISLTHFLERDHSQCSSLSLVLRYCRAYWLILRSGLSPLRILQRSNLALYHAPLFLTHQENYVPLTSAFGATTDIRYWEDCFLKTGMISVKNVFYSLYIYIRYLFIELPSNNGSVLSR